MTQFFRTYEQAIEFLFGRISYGECMTPRRGWASSSSTGMSRLLTLIGRPHEQLPVVHVAGTKGKGSTCVMAAEILTAAGYKTGSLTSPHVSAFEERITVDGVSPSPEYVSTW